MDYDPPTRTPSLREHLEATGLGRIAMDDSLAHYSVTMARHWLAITETAMRDEGVPPGVIDRVLRLLIYGIAPNPADAVMRQHAADAKLLQLANQAGPAVIAPERE